MGALAVLDSSSRRFLPLRSALCASIECRSTRNVHLPHRPQPTRCVRKHARTLCEQAGLPLNSPLSTLVSSKRLDRIRSQAKVVFDQYDQNRDGLLTAAELASYAQSVEACPLGEELQAAMQQLLSQVSSGKGPEATYDFEQFEWLYRKQLEQVQRYARMYLAGVFNRAEVEKTKFEATLKDDELAAAYWAFQSMDLSKTGEIPVSLLQTAPGIEGEILQAKVLEDLEGPTVIWSDYLKSYAKPKPVFLNMAILLAHTAVMWFILQMPVDLMIKGVLIAFVFFKPQFVTNSVIYVYNIFLTIVNNVRANLEVNQGGSTRFA